MSDRRNDPLFQKISSYMLTPVILLTAFLAQSTYTDIRTTLTRIEQRQLTDATDAAAMRERVAALERTAAAPLVGLHLPRYKLNPRATN